MNSFWSPLVHSLTPYVAGEQSSTGDVVKLNTNEHPYGPSPRVLAAIAQATDNSLRLYPDPAAMELRRAIGSTFGADTQEVFIGNGSDEVLAHTFQGLLNHEMPLLFPDVTYSFYRTYCRLYRIPFKEIPLDDQMRIRVEDYRGPSGAIIVPNPNAPTGIALPLEEIESLVSAHPDQVVVIDEAYVDFGAASAVPLTRTYPNLLVIQTFSKSRGLAGLRVGFAIGQRHLVEALERVKDSFNSYPIDRLALAGAMAAWEDWDWFANHRDLIIATRERLATTLCGLGFEVLPSSTNFLFARHPAMMGQELTKQLRERAVLVRHFPAERTQDFVRISIGTEDECARLVDALGKIRGQAVGKGAKLSRRPEAI